MAVVPIRTGRRGQGPELHITLYDHGVEVIFGAVLLSLASRQGRSAQSTYTTGALAHVIRD